MASRGEEPRAQLEEREVRVEDPSLSRTANERLTAELRDAVGAERVRVPADRPHPSRGERPRRSAGVALVQANRLLIALTFTVFVVIGAIVSVTTNDWWFLPLAAGVHAIGTMLLVVMALRMMTITERPEPTLVAQLEEEGVPRPEAHFSALVSEFAPPEAPASSASLTGAGQDRTGEAELDPARAAAEQRTAITPTGGPSPAVGEASLPGLVSWLVVLGLAVVTIIAAALSGGGNWVWLVPAVAVPCAVGWVALRTVLARAEPRGGEPPATPPSRRRLRTAIVSLTGLVVAVFCVLVALAMPHP